ncbi:MAG: hypothetical protein R3C61_16200 [Bacteroidia bacterium]
MKYFEYVYLILSIMTLLFMATEYENLNGRTIGLLLLAMFLFSFMFVFRRRQRMRVDAYLEEERRKLEQEIEEDN